MTALILDDENQSRNLIQFTILLLFLAFHTGMYSQALSPTVVSTAGGYTNTASGMLSFTIGEMSAVETLTSSSAILTQGFQQYWDLGTYVIEDPNLPISFGIYPNLSNGHFNLVTESELNEYVDLRILDLTGIEIFKTSFHHDRGKTIESIDIADAAPGMYLVSLSIKENKNSKPHLFIEKIQIIK